jgi:hypothetical protein
MSYLLRNTHINYKPTIQVAYWKSLSNWFVILWKVIRNSLCKITPVMSLQLSKPVYTLIIWRIIPEIQALHMMDLATPHVGKNNNCSSNVGSNYSGGKTLPTFLEYQASIYVQRNQYPGPARMKLGTLSIRAC